MKIKRAPIGFKAAMVILTSAVLLSVTLAMGFGTSSVSFVELYQCVLSECNNPVTQTILFDLRGPRIAMGFLAGFALAAAGALMQNVTRNPLADPYLFGIVSGAGLGATLSVYLPPAWHVISLPLSAFIGSLFAVVIVLLVLSHSNWRRIEHLLLAGVAVSFLLSAFTSFALYFSEAFASNRVIFWLMGSLARTEITSLYWTIPVVLLATFVILILGRQLDALLLSDESARTLGVNVAKLRLISLLVCAAMTAVIVAFCGGIAFVGLMIPHLIRPFFGLTTAKLFIYSGIAGGCFLIWVDVIARTLISGQELPIGVITSVIGSVFFLSLMRKM